MDNIEKLIKSLQNLKAELEKAAKVLPTSSSIVGIPAEKVKEAKIKNLQRQIDAGTYKPDPKKIADKIIKKESVEKQDHKECIKCDKNGQWSIESSK